jgi:hypothetical protein
MKEITIDLRNLRINGNILDISLRGNVIISEIINKISEINDEEKIEKDFITWGNDEIACDICVYDQAFAFFSLNKIWARRLDKIIKEVKKVLKDEGRLTVWDLYPSSANIAQGYNIKARLTDDKIVAMPYKLYYRPMGAKFNDVIRSLEKNDFIILSSRIDGNYYYIEAIKKKEDKKVTNENNSCST